jgi:hypothetical protein
MCCNRVVAKGNFAAALVFSNSGPMNVISNDLTIWLKEIVCRQQEEMLERSTPVGETLYKLA